MPGNLQQEKQRRKPGRKNGRVNPTGGETKAEWKEKSEKDEIGRKKTGREEKNEKAV